MFETLLIDEKVSKQLTNDLRSGKLSHAVILEGADEYTREKAAIEIASFLLCTGDDPPCEKCASCRKISHGSHPDLHFLKKEAKATAIKVDDVRRFKEKATLLPNDGEKSVFVILEAQDMNVQAQNALLKIFEEPAVHVSFILTAPSKSAFLETIISRGSLYSLSAAKDENESDEQRKRASDFASGLAAVLVSRNEFDFIAKLPAVKKDKEFFALVLASLTLLFRDALILQKGLDECVSSSDRGIVSSLGNAFDDRTLLSFIEVTKRTEKHLKSGGNFNLLSHQFSSGLFYQISKKR